MLTALLGNWPAARFLLHYCSFRFCSNCHTV